MLNIPFTTSRIIHAFSRSRNQALDEEITRLKRSASEWEKRYRDKEQEYFSFKEKQLHTPEVKLQAKIDMLTLEKVTPLNIIKNKFHRFI